MDGTLESRKLESAQNVTVLIGIEQKTKRILIENLEGQVFGKLTVLNFVRLYQEQRYWPIWLCRCECGAIKEVRASSLKAGISKSCGCMLGGPTIYENNEKQCVRCKRVKNISEFPKKKRKTNPFGSICKRCVAIASKEWRKENPEKYNLSQRVWFQEHKKEWYNRTKDARNIKNKKLRRSNPLMRLRSNISNSINYSLRTGKGASWEKLLGYNVITLKKHLEKKFCKGMTWENYGGWHVDHIIPVSAFNFTSTTHLDFKRCWALTNLQPLWAKENLSKRDKLAKPFQPCLQLEA